MKRQNPVPKWRRVSRPNRVAYGQRKPGTVQSRLLYRKSSNGKAYASGSTFVPDPVRDCNVKAGTVRLLHNGNVVTIPVTKYGEMLAWVSKMRK